MNLSAEGILIGYFSILIIYWIFGFIWWKRNVYKKVEGYNSEVWETIGLWIAIFGGIFIFIYQRWGDTKK